MKWLVILILCTQVFSLSLDERRKRIINIIDEELSEVSRLAKSTRYKNPDHLLRMAELNLEKARLWREKENQEYLALSENKRRRVKKETYFKRSKTYFSRAYKYCKNITQRYRTYRRMGDVYYILGYYAKEEGRATTAASYLSKATRSSTSNSKVKQKSVLSLAELYFNEKKYSKAIPLYDKALRSKKDKWWTKDSFNHAWSLYRTGKESQAISKMREVHVKSRNKNYIDMRAQVERDIGIMYATTGKIREGESFYKRIGVDFSSRLLSIGRVLKTQEKFTQAKAVFNNALRYAKTSDEKSEALIEQLDLYAKYNKYSDHLIASRKLFQMAKSKQVSSSAKEKLIYHLKKQGALVQKQVAADTYEKVPKVRSAKAKVANEYFQMTSILDPRSRQEYLYLQAETAKLVKNDSLSFLKYKESYNTGDEKFKKQSMNGMLLMLGSKRISNTVKNNQYANVYSTFIKDFKGDKREDVIYQKLFKVYEDKNDYTNAKKTLDQYVKRFPSKISKQEVMIASLMEKDKNLGKDQALNKWIQDINSGKYKVSNSYKTKLKELLTSMQIEGVQKKLAQGKKAEALKGYHRVLKDPYATQKAKVNAKYNISALYFELSDVEKSFSWAMDALSQMQKNEVEKFSPSFLTMSNLYFAKLEFMKSIRLNDRMLNKLCSSKKSVKNTVFKNAALLSIAQSKIQSAKILIEKAKKCKIYSRYIEDVQLQLLDLYMEKKQWNEYESLVNILSRNPKLAGKIIPYLGDLLSYNEEQGNNSEKARYSRAILSKYEQAKKMKLTISSKAYDEVASLKKKDLIFQAKKVTDSRLSFPDNVFNRTLQNKLKNLDLLTTKVISFQKIGSALGIVQSYEILIKTYEELIKQINIFSPAGKSEAYIQSFKKNMQQLIAPLTKTYKEHKLNAKKSIYKNNILADESWGVLFEKIAPKYIGVNNAVIMDRSGN